MEDFVFKEAIVSAVPAHERGYDDCVIVLERLRGETDLWFASRYELGYLNANGEWDQADEVALGPEAALRAWWLEHRHPWSEIKRLAQAASVKLHEEWLKEHGGADEG